MLASSSWHSYPSIYNLGHRAVSELLNYPHVIEEKVDGSQFSFGLFEDEVSGEEGLAFEKSTGLPRYILSHPAELRIRSKGAQMHIDAPEKMFNAAAATVRELKDELHIGWTYRAEYLSKPHHNTLHYDRIPAKHLILFDVSTGDGEWLTPKEKAAEAKRLGLEIVPTLNFGSEDWELLPTTLESLRNILDNTQSILGGQLIEGVVIKPMVPLFGVDKKTLMGKFVSERFRESHKIAWKENNPTTGDIVQKIIQANNTPARYAKAVQHLRDAGQITDSPKDIGKLLIELERDLGTEEKESIKTALWKHFWPQIARGVKAGFPEYYKQELLRLQFERGEVDQTEAGRISYENAIENAHEAEAGRVDSGTGAEVTTGFAAEGSRF